MPDEKPPLRMTPIKGVRVVTPRPVGERPALPTPVTNEVAVSRTVSDQDIQNLERRSKETKNVSISTLDHVTQLRQEVTQRINVIDSKVDGVIGVVSDLRVQTAEQTGMLTAVLDGQAEARTFRENTQRVVTTTRIAEVEVDKTRQLAGVEVEKTRALTDIGDKAAAKALRRELVKSVVLKALVGIGALWAVVSTYYLSRR